MLFLHGQTTHDPTLSPEDIQNVIGEYQAWSRKMREAGSLLDGDKLADDGGLVLRGAGETFTVTDGPMAESKEVIGGVFQFEARDYDHVAELARACPHLKFGGAIEGRQIDEV